mgnify:CR=1 FL=1
MKTKNIFLNTLVVIIFLNTNYLIAQTNTSPTQTVCAGSIAEPYLINPASPGSIYYWSISGGGVIASGQGTNQIFVDWSSTPGGPYTIAVVEEDVNGCFGDSIKVEVTIADAAIASTINTDNICEGSAYTVSGATASNYSSLSWSSSGTGTFILGSTLTPVYTPSASDISNGNVTLTLTAHGNAPCIDATSNILLSIIPLPSVDAGSDDNICEGSTFTPNTTLASNYSSISWSTSGTGTFTLGNTLTPIYTPSSADITNGSVVLTISVLGSAPCNITPIISSMILNIIPAPISDAGSDDYICQGVDYTFITGYASTLHSASVSWVTSGDGTFTNVSTLTPTYSPGPNDVINGTVDLSLISTGNNPCATDVDDMTLIINQAPSTGPINHW